MGFARLEGRIGANGGLVSRSDHLHEM